MQTEQFLNGDEYRWQTISKREKTVEQPFYYAVKTTGIFCRPGCASRLPNRDNVEFFDSCEEAQQAGYRPCRRCRPQGLSAEEEKEAMIVRACRAMDQSETPLKLADLAAQSGLSPGHFHRLFKRMVGVTPKEYAAMGQLQRFRVSLKKGQTVTEAIYEAGYSSTSRVYETSQQRLAMAPKVYRSGGEGLAIEYAVGQCFLGLVLVAATEQGICAIEFGDDQASLKEQLKEDFPKARLHEAGPDFTLLVDGVIACIETAETSCTLPLDIQGTAFQQRVWHALRQIPPGSTASYAEIAKCIGQPDAARAVARACAGNRLAVAIPCHRVVRSDGGISGYRWGVERKRLLLDREKNKKGKTRSNIPAKQRAGERQ